MNVVLLRLYRDRYVLMAVAWHREGDLRVEVLPGTVDNMRDACQRGVDVVHVLANATPNGASLVLEDGTKTVNDCGTEVVIVVACCCCLLLGSDCCRRL